MGIGAQGRDHAPVGNIVHGVGNAVKEIDHGKEPDKWPARELCVECGIHDKRGGKNADDEPRFVFAPACSGALNNIAHNRIVERVKYTCTDHNSGHSTQLGSIQPAGKKYKGENKVREQVVDHIPSYGSKREHDQIAFESFLIFHDRAFPK